MNAELFRRLHPLFSAFLTPETAGILLSLARPALRLASGGSSALHLGDRPLLPSGEPWPTAGGRPMRHLCTIDFAAMPRLDGLPARGHASFYHSAVVPGVRDDESVSGRVYAHDLEPASPPVPSVASAGRSWGVAPFWSLPSPLDPALDLLERVRPGTLGPYRFLYESWLEQVWSDGAPRHQIGGWPVLLEADRARGPLDSGRPPLVQRQPASRPVAETTAAGPAQGPIADQVIRLTDRSWAKATRKSGRSAPSLRDPLPSRLGRVSPQYAAPGGAVGDRDRGAGDLLASSLLSAGTGTVRSGAGKPVSQPTACHPSGASDGDASAFGAGPSKLDPGCFRREDDHDPAFLFPRRPRRSVSVLPSNVDSVRLEEVRAAVEAARTGPAEGRGATDKTDQDAREASEARKAATRRLTDQLRERLNGGRLVVQLDSDPALGWFWGDPGSLSFMVQPDAPLESARLTHQAL
ncbi:DUF1963 domain-containing protein [Spirillospora sp. NPDC049652]